MALSLNALGLRELDIHGYERHLLAMGQGRDEAALRAESTGLDPDGAAARLADIEAERALLTERRDALVADRARAEDRSRQLREGRDAVATAQQMETAAADARAAAERFARVLLARTLLTAAITRFRRDREGPLLRAASAHFAALTGHRYLRLGVDEDESGRAVLLAVRADDSECPVEALSEGARDQLYLALRVAAIEDHASRAEPLPFIADDLLVNFDDARAAAALDLLAQLERTSQVILFTHHDHIVSLAAGRSDVAVRHLNGAGPPR